VRHKKATVRVTHVGVDVSAVGITGMQISLLHQRNELIWLERSIAVY
jgi:hypothetical protein